MIPAPMNYGADNQGEKSADPTSELRGKNSIPYTEPMLGTRFGINRRTLTE